jgi:hypothetical protein
MRGQQKHGEQRGRAAERGLGEAVGQRHDAQSEGHGRQAGH